MKKAEGGEDGISVMESGEEKDHSPDLESHQEILNLISGAALLTRSVLCCKRTFDDLLERIIQTGPFFASLGKLDQGKTCFSFGRGSENFRQIGFKVIKGMLIY